MARIFIFLLYFACQKILANEPPNFCKEELLRTKIKIAQMVASDQTVRFEILAIQKESGGDSINRHPYLIKVLQQVDEENTKELQKFFQKYGWPQKNIFGKKYCHDIWLLTQHADQNLAIQKRALKLLEIRIRDDKSEASHFAYLWDRVQINQLAPQKYGTQGRCIKPHHWQPFPLEDETNIEKLRRANGLGSFRTYKSRMDKYCL